MNLIDQLTRPVRTDTLQKIYDQIALHTPKMSFDQFLLIRDNQPIYDIIGWAINQNIDTTPEQQECWHKALTEPYEYQKLLNFYDACFKYEDTLLNQHNVNGHITDHNSDWTLLTWGSGNTNSTIELNYKLALYIIKYTIDHNSFPITWWFNDEGDLIHVNTSIRQLLTNIPIHVTSHSDQADLSMCSLILCPQSRYIIIPKNLDISSINYSHLTEMRPRDIGYDHSSILLNFHPQYLPQVVNIMNDTTTFSIK